MEVLLAEDDAASQLILKSMLKSWGYTVITADDGNKAWQLLCEPGHPQLVLLDWMMPGIEGPEIVRRLRLREPDRLYYTIIITANNSKESAASALSAGADDFVSKPFDAEELRARVAVGCRMNTLQNSLSNLVENLKQTLERVKQLEGIIPICMYCKKIRDDQDGWSQLELYISQNSEAKFSHGICPQCLDEQKTLVTNYTSVN